MHIAYHVGRHDGGFAYRLGDVWSEPFPTHALALAAARDAAARQRVKGSDTRISYQTADGRWHFEYVRGGDRPDTEVLDDWDVATTDVGTFVATAIPERQGDEGLG